MKSIKLRYTLPYEYIMTVDLYSAYKNCPGTQSQRRGSMADAISYCTDSRLFHTQLEALACGRLGMYAAALLPQPISNRIH